MSRRAFRRIVVVGVLGGVAGGFAWVRRRDQPGAPGATPEWPPLTAVGDTQTGAMPTAGGAVTTSVSTADDTGDTGDAGDTGDTDRSAGDGGPPSSSFVNALVDAPDARSDASSGTWVTPLDDGTCPATHPIKANDNSGIYHVPGGRSYDRTKAERCYASEDAAAADGYRPAKA